MSLESEAAAAATAAEAPVGDREGGDSGNEPPAEELGGVAGAVVDVAWDVVRSIWTPGVNRGLLQCVALLFVMLLLNTVLLLVFFGPNIHLFVMLALTLVLGGLMAWFLQELTKAQAEAAAKAAAANEGASAESADSSQGAAGSGPQTPAKTKKEQ